MPKDQSRDYILPNQFYNVLKLLTQIAIPGVTTLYFALGQIWGLPYGEEVVGTGAAVITFLGLFLGYSTKSYNNSDAKFDGVIEVDEDEDGMKKANLMLKNYENPADVVEQDEVRFKVKGR